MNENEALRLLDVNFNRAAEGLRTLEDVARVIRRDASAAARMKTLRHDLAALAARIPRAERLAARAVYADAGTQITSSSESERRQWMDLVVAASERVTQSLRVIEEASKERYPDVAAACKQLRYRAYDHLAQVELRISSGKPSFPAPKLYVLVDCQLPLEVFIERLRSLREAGVELFQIRDKRCEAARLCHYSRAAVSAVGADRIIVNDRVDVALASGASGVHVGQEDLPLEEVQQQAAGRLWIGVSTHNLEQARQAQAAGADYIGCGPTFPSMTKEFEEFPGVNFLRQISAEIEVPAYAIGGIQTGNVRRVRETGVPRVAVGHAIWCAEVPADAARRFLRVLASDS